MDIKDGNHDDGDNSNNDDNQDANAVEPTLSPTTKTPTSTPINEVWLPLQPQPLQPRLQKLLFMILKMIPWIAPEKCVNISCLMTSCINTK